ncbi:MAG: hypothetical protein Q4G54_11240 [Pelistega sp.]|nr:hypothetical protein [Pelistega sp.]
MIKISRIILILSLFNPLFLTSCAHINSDASVDGVLGTVGGAFGNISQPGAPTAKP